MRPSAAVHAGDSSSARPLRESPSPIWRGSVALSRENAYPRVTIAVTADDEAPARDHAGAGAARAGRGEIRRLASQVIRLGPVARHARVEVREVAERVVLECPHVQLIERGQAITIGRSDEIHELAVEARGRRVDLMIRELGRPVVRELNELDANEAEEAIADRLVDESFRMRRVEHAVDHVR